MKVSPEEFLNAYVMGQLRAINAILSIADNHVYHDSEQDKNFINAESFKREIQEMGDKIKANYFPPYLP